MASFLKTSILSHLQSHPQRRENLFAQPSRGFHVDLGEREKALLAKDPALNRFKSNKQGVKRMKRVGDVLTIVVAAGCCYGVYVRANMSKEAKQVS
ncbi:succinate dehydrogenase subunit 7A, mitochondrial [Beta vulgaris subsp. vulgaris]|uniref:succinate dehydrogenase subunit 7A, mitochondrial n=1 Tax=Beta vulgaris subsp. vulgaris TaxID=3555 RepID=UPI0020370CFF|nr:succinate dehydrogenase subunit 7A, mitochondrial [Beta vulgaris subsp. vulgaris]